MEDLLDDVCFSIPSQFDCHSTALYIRTVVFFIFIMYYLYQFVSIFKAFYLSRDQLLRSAVYFWFFGFITCITCQVLLINANEFDRSPLKTFTWSLCSGLDHCPFIFMLNFLVKSFEMCNIYYPGEIIFIRVFSVIILIVGFLMPIVYMLIPEKAHYDDIWYFIPHFGTCIMTAISDTFFLYSLFRMFYSETSTLHTYIGSKLMKTFQRGIIFLSFVLLFRNALLVIGSVPHFSLRMMIYYVNPERMRNIFVADYCLVDFMVYLLPYMILANGVSMNTQSGDDSESDVSSVVARGLVQSNDE